jgi:hypothetical protein
VRLGAAIVLGVAVAILTGATVGWPYRAGRGLDPRCGHLPVMDLGVGRANGCDADREARDQTRR